MRDPLLAKRNLFVIPGGLLIAYSLLAIAYGNWLRMPTDGCARGQVLLGGCQSLAVVMLPVLLLGIALVAVGLLRFRAQPDELEGHLHHGTGTHFVLVFLTSLVVVATAGWIWAAARQAALPAGSYVVVEAQGTQYQMTFVLQILLVTALLVLATAGGLFLTQSRLRRQFLAAAQQPDPVGAEAVTLSEATAALEEPEHGSGTTGIRTLTDSAWAEAATDSGWPDQEGVVLTHRAMSEEE